MQFSVLVFQLLIDVGGVVVFVVAKSALLRHCCGLIVDWKIPLQRQCRCPLVLHDLGDTGHFHCRC
jgi:hypothetical protein